MIAIFDNVITKQECDILKSRIESWYFLNRSDDQKQLWDWKKRILDITPSEINPNHITNYETQYSLTDQYIWLQHEVCIKVIHFLQSRINVELKLDAAELQVWPMNTNCPIHSHKSGNRENNEFNSILYLNDNFNGGEFFTDTGLVLKPITGRLTFFDGRSVNHGVNDIYDGNRYTIIFWWNNKLK